MSIVVLWHKIQPTFMPIENLPEKLESEYEIVGQFNIPDNDVGACERVFALTQNIDSSWCDPPKRSTSVGDLMEIIHPMIGEVVSVYQVDMIGMKLMLPKVV